jgi:RHS repeat-associated protein
VRQLTDVSGTVTLTREYDPFGDDVSSLGSSTTTYGFTGEQTDPTGMVYLRARYYDPDMGRFMTRDSSGGDEKQPMSFNGWLYAYANPIMLLDPTGHDSACENVSPYQRYLCEQGQTKDLATLANRSRKYEDLPDSIVTQAPPLISWNPSENVPLSPSVPMNYQWAQGNPYQGPTFVKYPKHPKILNRDDYCGEISLSMIAAIYNGNQDILPEHFNNRPVEGDPHGTSAKQLLGEVVKAFPDYWYGYAWTGEKLSYADTMQGYKLSVSAGNWSGKPIGSKATHRLRDMLSYGAHLMVQVGCTNPNGRIVSEPDIAHWVVLTGLSAQWQTDESSIWNWVRVNNPYNNQVEYYPWRIFKDSMAKLDYRLLAISRFTPYAGTNPAFPFDPYNP